MTVELAMEVLRLKRLRYHESYYTLLELFCDHLRRLEQSEIVSVRRAVAIDDRMKSPLNEEVPEVIDGHLAVRELFG